MLKAHKVCVNLDKNVLVPVSQNRKVVSLTWTSAEEATVCFISFQDIFTFTVWAVYLEQYKNDTLGKKRNELNPISSCMYLITTTYIEYKHHLT